MYAIRSYYAFAKTIMLSSSIVKMASEAVSARVLRRVSISLDRASADSTSLVLLTLYLSNARTPAAKKRKTPAINHHRCQNGWAMRNNFV